MKTKLFAFLLIAAAAFGQGESKIAGIYYAPGYAYGVATNVGPARVALGNASTGAQTISLASATVTLPDGRVIVPFNVNAPINIGSGSNQEKVTPTAVSNCYRGAQSGVCQVTATFANTHGQGDLVTSATAGLQEAINDAFSNGGGQVSIDGNWTKLGGTEAMITAAVPYHSVGINDIRSGPPQWYSAGPSNTTVLATPTALSAQAACDATHTFCSDATATGTWTSGTLYGCVSYVDVMGNEGPCSTTANFTTVASKAVDVGAPAASTGAVGYTIYLSLIGGSYAFAYKVPLTSSICTLTTVETVTAACAVANSTYGQSAANAQVAAVTVNTARLAFQSGTISSTTDYVPNTNAHTVYSYIPANHVGLPGVVQASLPFPTAAATGTTVPTVIGSLTLPAGFMNYVGRTIEVCGYATEAANGSTSTITTMQAYWDADGSNAAGVPVLIGTIPMTNTLVTGKTDQYSFCFDFKTTVSGAGATAGTIQQNGGSFQEQYTSSSVATVPVTVLAQGPAAVGSLNLAGEARIDFVYLHTTGTDANGLLLQDLTVKELN